MHSPVPLSGFRPALHLHQVGIAAAQLLQLLRHITLASRLSLHSTQQEIRQHSTGASSCTYSHLHVRGYSQAKLATGTVSQSMRPVNVPSPSTHLFRRGQLDSFAPRDIPHGVAQSRAVVGDKPVEIRQGR